MDNATDSVNVDLENSLRHSGLETEDKKEADQPIYRIFEGSKIPVPKHMGKLWASRKDQAVAKRSDIEDAWNEAIRYYENDQMSHRKAGIERKGGGRYSRGLNEEWSATENVVFSNVATMLPMLYAKNPNIEVTAYNTANESFGKCVEKLVDTLFSIRTAPGVNLKYKARRGVFYALLMNTVYAKIDFITKQQSSEGALVELQELSDEYAKAKNAHETKELEGEITALIEKVNILEPGGPKLRIIPAFRVFVDTTATEPDNSDALWMMEYDFLPTSYLKAVYAKEVGEECSEEYRSVYEPTHVLKLGMTTTEGTSDADFSLFANEKPEFTSYGYKNQASFDKACYTKVWYIWDKTTRRVFMYADNDWSWPLWVWDDPLKLLEFFPYDNLWFHESFENSQPKGEVTYYLDQQDTINDINSTVNKARKWARRNVIFNKNKITQDDVNLVLNGPDGTAKGIDIGEGEKIEDHIKTVVPPAMAYPELLSTDSSFAAINRITGTNDAQRGAQFKTNTTNEAINFYQKNVDIRVDERIDQIEDWLGRVAWKLIQLCCRLMTKEEVIELIGEDLGQHWKQVTDPKQLRSMLALRVIGGSTDKPTSKNKQEQALRVGQVLGQFSKSSPAIGIVVMRVFERAFDEIVIEQEDWDAIKQSMQQPVPADPNQQQPQGQVQGEQPVNPQDLQAVIERLPPEAKQALAQLMSSGVPAEEALKTVLEQLQQPPQ